MQEHLAALWTTLQDRFGALRRDPEAGYSTETVLVTALLVVAALAVIAILIAKVVAKVNGIEL